MIHLYRACIYYFSWASKKSQIMSAYMSRLMLFILSFVVLGPLNGTRSRPGIFKVVNVYFKSQKNQTHTAEHAAKNSHMEMGRNYQSIKVSNKGKTKS